MQPDINPTITIERRPSSTIQDIKCLLGMHRLHVYREEAITDPRGNVIGRAIVSQCLNCGRIKITNVRTVSHE